MPVARVASRAITLGFILGFLAWAALLRPTSLGGSTTYVVVSGDSMLPTYRAGDLIVAQPADAGAEAAAVGSVVVYRIPAGLPGAGRLIIHRVVAFDAATGYTTRGDHNSYTDIWHPTAADIVGVPATVLPGAGNAVAFARQPIVAASFAALFTMFWLVLQRRGQGAPVRARQVLGDPRHAPDVGYTAAQRIDRDTRSGSRSRASRGWWKPGDRDPNGCSSIRPHHP